MSTDVPAEVQTPPPESFPDADSEWRRLSRRMLLVHPVTEIVRFIPALLALLLGGRANGGGGHYWSLIGVGVAVALGVSRWFTTTYRITPKQVQLRKGLLRKRSLNAPLDRVRTVDVTANPMHRLLGLSRLAIGTGVNDKDKDGLLLDGLTVTEASRLRGELLSQRGTPTPAPSAGPAGPVPTRPEQPLASWSAAWVRYGPFSLSGLVTIGAAAVLLSRVVNEGGINPDKVGPVRTASHQIAQTAPVLVALGAVILVLVVVAIASTAGYVLAFWNFRLTRYPAEGTLHVTRGLVTTRATTIEEARLRGLELSEPLLLRAVGGARLIAVATGLRVGRGSERGGSLLLPPAPQVVAHQVAGHLLTDPAAVTVPLRQHGPAATRRRWTRALGAAAVLVVLLELLCWSAGLPTAYWVAALLPLPLAALLARDRARSLGHTRSGGYLISRRGSLVRRRLMLQTDGVVGVMLRQSYFQRRLGITTLTTATAAGRQGYPVQDLPDATAVALAQDVTPGLLEPFLR